MTAEADLQRLYARTQGLEMADGWWHRTVNELECHRTIYLKIAKMANFILCILTTFIKTTFFYFIVDVLGYRMASSKYSSKLDD